jgi:mono/diheme cytochrome c family protein
MVVSAATARAQTSGDPNAGQQLFTTTLSPPCASCHSATDNAAVNSLTSIRNAITNRSTPAGAAGTMSLAKALEALNAALTGTSLGGRTTGMNSLFPALTATQRNDLAAYIAQVAGPAPVLRYSPATGLIFPATAVGATATATATISNVGTADLVFATNNAVTIASGIDTGDFRVASTNCAGVTLRPNTGNCTVSIEFRPAAGASLTRSASIGLTTSTGVTLVPLTASVVEAASTAVPTSSAANPPAGGGGVLTWTWVLTAVLASAARRRLSSSQ